MVCCSGVKIDFNQLVFNSEFYPIRCIDCGIVIAEYGEFTNGCIISYGYHDTLARFNSADSLRCGKCYIKYAFKEEKNERLTIA